MINTKIMNDTIQVRVELDNKEANDNRSLPSVTMILTVEEPITIEGIEGKFIKKVKGKMSGENKSLHEFTLARSMQVLQKGEEYRFPFELPRTSNVETYKGKNFSVLYELEFKIELEQSSYDSLKKGVFKNIKSFFTGEKHFKDSVPIIFEQPRKSYEVVESSGDFTLKSNIVMIAIVGVLFLVLSLAIFSMNIEAAIFGTIIGAIVGYILQKILIKSTVGGFHLEVINEEDEAFLAVVQSDNHWKLVSNPNLRYEVIEEVIDRRGTSTSTYTEKLFSSPTTNLSSFNQEKQAVFTFPERHFPVINLKDASIKWLMKLEMQTSFGFKLKYDKEFKLKN